MFCIFCGKEIEDNSKFCAYCGGVIDETKVIEESKQTVEMSECSSGFKDKTFELAKCIIGAVKSNQKRSMIIGAIMITLCAIGVGIYFGYEDQPVVNNMVSSSLPVIKRKEHKEEKKNYDTIEIKADDTKDIQFLLNEQKEKDRQGFSNEAKRIARLYLEARGDNNDRESYKYLTATKKEAVGGIDGWLKQNEYIRSTMSNIQIDAADIDGNKALVHYRGVSHSNGFFRSYSTMVIGLMRLSREGTTVGVD